jgi:hypothetical protein
VSRLNVKASRRNLADECRAACSLWAIAMAILIPDAPHSSRWFSRRECVVIMSRKRHDHYTVDKRQLHWDQVWDTVKDVKTYLYFFLGWVGAVDNGLNSSS